MRGMRILIADDEEALVDILKRYLAGQGYSGIDVIFEGKEALALIKTNGYDIAFLDEHMPNVSGPEIVKYIKDNGLKTKAVIITGRFEAGEGIDESARADAYLIKPFHLQAIEDVIKKYQK